MVLKLCYAQESVTNEQTNEHNERTNQRMNKRTDKPEAISTPPPHPFQSLGRYKKFSVVQNFAQWRGGGGGGGRGC